MRYLEHGELFFERHASKAVFPARWLPGVRVVGPWLAALVAHAVRLLERVTDPRRASPAPRSSARAGRRRT